MADSNCQEREDKHDGHAAADGPFPSYIGVVHQVGPDAVAPELNHRQPSHVQVLKSVAGVRVAEQSLDDGWKQQRNSIVDKGRREPDHHQPPGDRPVLLVE